MADGLFGPNDPPPNGDDAAGCSACGQRLVHAMTCPEHPSNVETPLGVHTAIAALVPIVNGDDYDFSGVSLVVERRPGGPGVDVKVTLRPRVPSGTISVKVVRSGDLGPPAQPDVDVIFRAASACCRGDCEHEYDRECVAHWLSLARGEA